MVMTTKGGQTTLDRTGLNITLDEDEPSNKTTARNTASQYINLAQLEFIICGVAGVLIITS